MSIGLLASAIPLLICLFHRMQAVLVVPRDLPARLSRLPRVTMIVIPSSAAGVSSSASAKALAAAWTVRLRLGFINLKGSAAEFGTVQCCNSLLSFTRIRHFDECKTARTSGFPIRHHADLVNLAVCLEETAQLGLGGAMRQISHVKVLHCTFSMIT